MPANRRKSGDREKSAPLDKNADQGGDGARINQLFQDAIRDLEKLKQGRKPA